MSDSGYPEDIHQYDNDPRSPFYDDKGYEAAWESKYNEFLDNPDDIEVDLELIGEAMMSIYCSKDYDRTKDLHDWLYDYLAKCADKQATDYLENLDES